MHTITTLYYLHKPYMRDNMPIEVITTTHCPTLPMTAHLVVSDIHSACGAIAQPVPGAPYIVGSRADLVVVTHSTW